VSKLGHTESRMTGRPISDESSERKKYLKNLSYVGYILTVDLRLEDLIRNVIPTVSDVPVPYTEGNIFSDMTFSVRFIIE
jgi:hypothetical protein